LHNNSLYTLEQTINWFNNTNPEFYTIYYNDEKIGYFRTSNLIENQSIYIGADLHISYRGKGLSYVSYCEFIPFIINKHNLKSIYLEVLSSNIIAKKLYDKLGFQVIDIQCNKFFRNNQFIDNIIMKYEI
jgi:RimJ/RimL family protein N-acetyltransferase